MKKYNRIIGKLALIIILLTNILVLNIYAQTGPGGVGNNSGAGNLKFWLRGDSVSIDTGVDTLFDLSGYNNHFVQSNTTYQPAITTINGFDVLDFDGAGDFLLDDDGESYINGQSAFSLLFVIKSDNASTDKGWFITETPTGADDSLSIRYDAAGALGGQSNVIRAGSGAGGIVESSASSQSTSNQLVTFSWISNATPELYIDGTQDALSYGNLIVGSVSGSDRVILGKGGLDTGVGDGWDGIVAEVIYFNKQINSAERTVVENYLATRYNLTISNDEYTPDDAGYIYDVVGIGVESDGDHNGSVSAGFGINEDNSTLDTDGEYIFASHDNTTNDIASIKTDVEVTTNLGASGAAWNRSWYMAKSGGANIDLRIYFDFGDGIEGGGIPQNITNYRLLYRVGTSGNYSIVTTSSQGIQSGDQMYFEVSNANIANGYYTIGTIDQTNSPVEGSSTQTWYTLVSGNWKDKGEDNIWTLDASGALPNNPNDEIPDENDNVVVLSGKTVTVSESGYILKSIEVEGRLYLGSTNSHDFTDIGGNGRIYIEEDYFPAGDSTDFITAGLDEGTVVYSGSSNYSITTSITFYNMEIIMNNTTDTVTLMCDYILNGNLKVEKGTFRINDNDAGSTTPLVLDIEGDVDVYSAGIFTVGTGNAYSAVAASGYGNYHKGIHQIYVGGDFTNQGIVRFTNQPLPDYENLTTTGGVSLVFDGATNNTFTCEDTTDLYNLVIDKGTDQTYALEIYAEDTSHFAMYGQNDDTWNNTDAANPENRKALWIKAGTLRLSGELYIPSLVEGSRDFTIGENARLYLDGPNVFVSNTANESSTYTDLSHGSPNGVDNDQTDQGLYILGKLQVDNGKFLLGEAEAINFGTEAAGVIVVNGGELEANQISSAASGDFSYIQTGGIVRLTSEYIADADKALLHLNNGDMVFTMSDGEIIIEGVAPTDPGTETNGILIASDEGNYSVTGGTLTINYTGGTNVEINSTANFYDLTIKQNTDVLCENALEVSNDLTIENGADLNTAGLKLTIGEDFYFNDGATYTHGTNTTIFNGSSNSSIYVGNTTTASILTFNNLEIEKDQRYNPLLFRSVNVSSSGRTTDDTDALNTVIDIQNDLTIIRGEFDTYRFTVNLHGNIDITDGKLDASTTNPGRINLTGGSALHTINTSSSTASFGHIELDDANGAQLQSNSDFADFTLTTGIMDIGIYSMSVDSGRISGSSFGSTKMIKAAGNYSDRGLQYTINLDGAYTNETIAFYPIGTGTDYTPVEIFANGSPGTVSGTFRVSQGSSSHPAVNTPADVIPYYWRSEATGFSGIDETTISLQFTHHTAGDFSGGFNAAWITDDESEWNEGASTNTTKPDIPFSGVGFLNADWTAGKHSAFRKIFTYYSRQDGDWDTKSTWSIVDIDGAEVAGTGAEPFPFSSTDRIVVAHNVTISSSTTNTDVAGVKTYGAHPSTGTQAILNVGSATGLTFISVSGGGHLIDSTNTLPSADYQDFIDNDTAIIEFSGGDYTLLTTLSEYPTLLITGNANNTSKTLPIQDITVNRDLIINNTNFTGTTLTLSSGATGDITIEDSLVMYNQGKLVFPATGTERIVTVYDKINCDPDGLESANAIEVEDGVSALTSHELVVYGDIDIGGSSITFWRDATKRNANLIFMGTDNSDIANATPDAAYNIALNRLIIEKYSGSQVNFYEELTLNGETDGLTKALEITSGNVNFDNSNTDITLSSGGSDFLLPSGSELIIKNGILRVSGNNTGIKLDGKLQLNYNGQVLVNGGTNNYIEYTSSGTSEIYINQGTLKVGSQIRRQTYTTDGVLKFTQNHSNSTVVIGETDAIEGARGIFEILNTGSEFTQVADANITIVRQQTSPSIAALYLNPETPIIGAGASFTFGDDTNTPIDQIIGLNSSVNLKNIIVNSTNSPTVQMQIQTLTLEEDLTIESGSTFDANTLALNIQGDFTNSGTFEPNENTTTFSGSSDQKITGKTTFYNLTKSTSNALSLSETSTDTVFIENDFRIENGIFRDSSNAVSVKGDMLNNGTHIYGGTGNGIEMLGIVEQDMTGDGSGIFGMLTISNASGVGVHVDIGNELFIEDGLNLNGGVLDVGNNLLDLSVNAQIIEGSTFSSSNMIRTNISFTDNGVRKTLPSTADAGGPYDYIIPIGSGDKYTPVEYKITENDNSTGTIITKAADERHPSIVNDFDDPEIADSINVLQYHWVVKSSGISGFSADVEMKYYPADIYAIGPYDVTDYITARLLNDGSGNWNKYDADDFDEANSLCLFNFDNVGDEEIEGDYTAGIDDAIPDQVPFYETNNSGSWTDGSIWTPNVAGGPRGAMVRINTDDTVYIPSNFKSSYTTTINGRLEVDSTFGHRAGEVSGTGTLYTKRASLPAGYYTDFFASTGGTLEYGGSANYDILAGFTQVNNLKLSGTGERRFPNQDVTLLGDITIDGDDATLNVINDHDQKISIGGDISFVTGSFDAGDGANAIIELNGTSAQSITGNFTGTNNFYHFTLNNANGVTLSGPIDIDGDLTLTSGVITTSVANILSMTDVFSSVSGYSSSNYVDGPMKKNLSNGSTFIFPLGDATRYGKVEIINTLTSGPQYWETEYYNANPDASMDTSFREAGLEMVSGNEYWRVKGPASGTSPLQIRWDSNSMLPAMTDDRPNNLKMVEWIPDQWEIVTPATVTDGGVNSGSIISDNSLDLDDDHYFTIGTTESAPLPTAGFTSSDTSICAGGTASLIVELTGTAPWTIKVDSAGINWTHTAIAASPYTINTSPADNTTYTITEVTDDTPTTSTTTIFGSPVTVTVIPVPDNSFTITPSGTDSYCAGGTGVAVGLNNSETGVNYDLYRDGSPAGSSAAGSTGSSISFGNQTVAGLYEVYATDATDASGTCTVLMAGNLTISINPLPDATLTANAALDSICDGNNTQISIDFTAGTGPFDFTITDGTTPENLVGIAADPYTFNPVTAPVWVDDGSPDTDYYYTITTITDTNGCTNTNIGNEKVTLFKIPETGAGYHIPNDSEK
ncbi:MAG: G8 domain-containing protein [Bacteroidales bacterium]|nr:G8 domain-containing protein [Bacteroidales bacterium]